VTVVVLDAREGCGPRAGLHLPWWCSIGVTPPPGGAVRGGAMGADRPLSGWEQKAERRDRAADRRERPTDASEIGRFEQATVDRELDASYRQAPAEDRAAAARDRAAAAAMSKRRGRIGRRPQIETHPGGIGWRPPRTGRGRRGSRAGGGRAGPARLRPHPRRPVLSAGPGVTESSTEDRSGHRSSRRRPGRAVHLDQAA